ncbi:aspartate aminotransferase family protein [Plantactinospora sp. WMMB334]|uniref:aspartate aminotransferase family protein n=1 Tax=Plantactinospora sp. WMMB334 TaxID=3404119 RepID=UPI003B94AD28
MHTTAQSWLPGGDTRTLSYFTPYPTFMASGHGCVITDVDGNDYLDFVNNMGSLIHGHAHPDLVAAASEQAALGTALGAPVELQIHHARILCDRIPSADLVRYTNSGTEATMLALRAARAATGRDLIVKIDGGYHGMHNDVNMLADMSDPAHAQAGLPATFPPIRIPRGVPRDVRNHVLLVRYNDLAQAGHLLALRSSRIAALIVEPMMGAAGCIPADPGYLCGLRALTHKHDILLILDECNTFRLGPLQTRYNVHPDLTITGKIIGGGLPLGAVGGRADIMARFDPSRDRPLWHTGAHVGNGLALRVGIAALEAYGPPEVSALNNLGEQLIRELPDAAREAGVRLQVTGIGSQAHLHWGDGQVRDADDSLTLRASSAELPELVHLELLNRGIFTSRRGIFTLSTPMTDEHVQAFVRALRGSQRREWVDWCDTGEGVEMGWYWSGVWGPR